MLSLNMERSFSSSLTGPFVRFMVELRSDLRIQSHSDLNLDLLRLKRQQMDEGFNDFIAGMCEAVALRKASVEQDMIKRGVSSSTIRSDTLQVIDNAATVEFDKATHEYSSGLEELSSLEHRFTKQNGLGGKNCLVAIKPPTSQRQRRNAHNNAGRRHTCRLSMRSLSGGYSLRHSTLAHFEWP